MHSAIYLRNYLCIYVNLLPDISEDQLIEAIYAQ